MALRGNHEEMLLEYVCGFADPEMLYAWESADSDLASAKSFLAPKDFERVQQLLAQVDSVAAYRYTVKRIKVEHSDVIAWILRLPYYYKSNFCQVFVHAGVDEEAGDFWDVGTPADWFTGMLPEYVGSIDLDVIAGHIDTETVSGIRCYRGIWFDGASHYYIDANAVKYGEVAVLTYDSDTGEYSGPSLG